VTDGENKSWEAIGFEREREKEKESERGIERYKEKER
jgi:hypothetical protein